MEPTPQAAQDQVFVIDDALWEELIELTGGAAAPCYQCGVCTTTCPWSLVKDEVVSVRRFIRQAQLGLQDGNHDLWLCTTCAQCEAYCPRGVPISEVFRGLRYLAWERRATPEGLPSLLWSVYWNNNPWSQPPSQRSQWAKDQPLPTFDPKRHEILFYVGCTSSYDRRAQKVARALARLLKAGEVSFGSLGDDEPCCGEAALNVGHKPYFEETAQQAARVFQEKGVTQLVTVSPHCYDVFKNHYPSFNGDFQPFHYTQYLAGLVDEGRLAFEGAVNLKVVFHDPCYLARHNDESQAPRRVLEAVPGVELVEMENAGLDTLCCGGGGGRMWLETASGERFSDLRVQEACRTGAGVLATACPFCITCLEDSLKAQKIEDLAVMDVAEIAALALVE
jgi:Fe-S oxidoreductase